MQVRNWDLEIPTFTAGGLDQLMTKGDKSVRSRLVHLLQTLFQASECSSAESRSDCSEASMDSMDEVDRLAVCKAVTSKLEDVKAQACHHRQAPNCMPH